MKKAQIEMIGLLLVVILLVLGGLIFLRFTVRPEPVAQDSTIRLTQAYNTLNALTRISLCDGTTIKSALASCADRPTDILCDDLPSCDLLKKTLPTILDRSLTKALALNYSLTARTESSVFLTIPGCTTGPLPSYTFQEEGKNYELQLRLCKN